MKFKSHLLTALSGKMGGVVAASARGVQYFRAFRVPVNPATAFQNAVRNAVKTISQRWSTTLTATQRTAWNVYGGNVTTLDNQGNTLNLAGNNWYTAMNVPRVQAGLTVVDDAPTIFDVGNPVTFSMAGSFSGSNASLNFTQTATGAAGDRFLVYGSRPFSPGRSEPVGGNRLLGVMSANGASSFAVFTLPWTVGVGQKINITTRLSRADGRLSSTFQLAGAGV